MARGNIDVGQKGKKEYSRRQIIMGKKKGENENGHVQLPSQKRHEAAKRAASRL